MRNYSSAEISSGNNTWERREYTNILSIVHSLFSYFSKTESLEIIVPTNVYIRTQLLCEYISEKVGVSYDISNFLMTLYSDFLQTSIEKYNPMKIHGEINRSHGYDDTLLIHANDTIYKYNKRESKQTILSISIEKKDAEKGKLLLEEMDDLYGQAPTLQKLIATLWINYIEDYKAGNKQTALNDIIRILKKTNND